MHSSRTAAFILISVRPAPAQAQITVNPDVTFSFEALGTTRLVTGGLSSVCSRGV